MLKRYHKEKYVPTCKVWARPPLSDSSAAAPPDAERAREVDDGVALKMMEKINSQNSESNEGTSFISQGHFKIHTYNVKHDQSL